MATQLATAYVPIVPTVTGLQGQLAQQVLHPSAQAGDKAGKTMGGKIKSGVLGSMKGMLLAGAGLMGAAALGQQVGKAITGAGNLEQSIGAIDSVFKTNSGTMHKWSKDAARNVGLSRNEFNELGTLIGSQLKNGGTAMEELAPKTRDLIGLGADLSSMFGGTTRESVEALSSALKGERDPIERYGVSLNQAKIDAEAASLGFEKVGGSLSAEANQAATLSLIMKQTADAHGNFARESDTYAHKVQVFGATWDDLRNKAGTLLLPVLTKVVGFMGERLLPALEAGGKWVGNFVGALQSIGDRSVLTPAIVERMGFGPDSPLGRGIGEIIGGVRAFVGAFQSADSDVTSSGLPGFMERLGFVARDVFGWISTYVPPVLAKVGDVITGTVLPAVGRFASWLVEHRGTIGTVVAVVGGFAAGWLAVAGAVAGVGLVIAGISKALFLARTAVVAVQGALLTARIAVMLFNSALLANPVGLVVGALVALGIGLVIAYKKSETFRAIVDGVWSGVKSAIAGVVDWWTGTVVPTWTKNVETIGGMFTWLKDNIIRPVFDGIKTYIAVTVAVWLTVFDGVKWALGKLGEGFMWLYDRSVRPALDLVSRAVEWVRGKVAEKFAAARALVQQLGDRFVELYHRWVKPGVDLVARAVDWVRSWISTRISQMRYLVQLLGDKFVELYHRWVKPAIDLVLRLVEYGRAWISSKFAQIRYVIGQLGDKFRELYDRHVRPKWDALVGKVRDGWDWVKRVAFDPLHKMVTKTIPDGFKAGVDTASKWWDGLKKKVSEPIGFVIDKVINNGFIKHFNNIAGKFGVKTLDPIEWRGFREGGRTGGARADEVRGLVHGREFVLNEQRTRELDRLAPGFLDEFHRRGAAAFKPGHAAVGARVYGGAGSFGNPLQHAIYASGRLSVRGSAPGWSLDQAIGMLDRATRVKVGRNVGGPVVNVQSGLMPAWWAGYYEGNTVRLNDAVMGFGSSTAKRTVAAHELGHALGLPHSDPSGLSSIMSYANMYRHNSVTAADVRALSAIYGGTGFGSGGGTPDDGGGLIKVLVDKIKDALGIDKLIERIPDGGRITELLGGAVRKVWDGIKTWIGKLNPFDLDGDEGGARGPGRRSQAMTAKLYDGGGLLEYSAQPQLVMHRSKRPDYVLPEQLFKDMHEAARASREDGAGGKLAEQLYVQGYTADEVAEAIERRAKQRKALTRR